MTWRSFANATTALIAMVLASGTIACAQERVMRLGYLFGSDSQLGIGAARFAAEVAQKSNNRYRIELYPDNTVGGEAEMLQDLQLGHLDLGFITSGPFAGMIPAMGVFDMAFLFRDLGHAHRTFDGPIGEEYLAKFQEKGLIGLAWGENGMRHVTNSKHAIMRPEDLKGLKLRVPQSAVMIADFKALGVDAQPLAFPALYGALLSGQFDGEENPVSVIASAHFDKVQKYLSLTGHVYSSAALLMSQRAWSTLSDEDKHLFVAAAKAGGMASREVSAKAERDQIEILKKGGMEVATTVDRAAFEQAVQAANAEIAKQFGDAAERVKAVK